MTAYVVIVEHKLEGPLVCEIPLDKSSYEDARKRMVEFSRKPDIIRVAIAELVYVDGHRGLLPPDEKPKEMPF